jgi:type IV pilus assembly protein PilB
VLRKKFLGEMLIEAGLITKEQRNQALLEQKRLGKRLGEVLTALKFVTEDNIAKTLSMQLDMPFKELKGISVPPSVLRLIPETSAKKHRVLPVDVIDGRLTIAMADPLDVFAIDEIKRLARMPVDATVSVESELIKAIDRHYRGDYLPPETVRMPETGYIPEEEAAEAPFEAAAEDTPVVRLVNSMLTQAVKDRASDIHIEPGEAGLRVRYRIDGVLHETMRPPLHLHPGIVSRIKILSGMDIAEKRIPQDGRFTSGIQGRQFDIRASTLPTLYGEKIVLRLLEKTTGLPSLGELGFSKDTLNSYERLIRKPYGFMLATGPTGCGKTTTMYSSLSCITTREKNIITVEDPIEYNLREINQVQVNPKAGLTFASGLRSILRQDPDVIMIGEIRDTETASIAIHAALTGHLVLSTLHTNEAVGAIARLIDMGIEPFLITSSVIGVMGQRLIRKTCRHCKEKYTDTSGIFSEIGAGENVELSKGKGCAECRYTGYMGREGLFELLTITEDIKRLIIERAPAGEIKKAALAGGFKTMRHEGLYKAIAGITTLEEVLRVAQEED